jgi:hypothetical protein
MAAAPGKALIGGVPNEQLHLTGPAVRCFGVYWPLAGPAGELGRSGRKGVMRDAM